MRIYVGLKTPEISETRRAREHLGYEASETREHIGHKAREAREHGWHVI